MRPVGQALSLCAGNVGVDPFGVPVEHDNQYVSVLFMEEGVRTVKEDVLRLAAGIHLLDGSFSQSGLTEAAKFVKAALEPLSILHSLRIATSARSSVTAVRVDARNLVQITLGPQKHRPVLSPVVIIRIADLGFGVVCLPVLASVKIPKNDATLQNK